MRSHSFYHIIDGNKMKIHRYGKGERMLLIFHGFGESGKNYLPFADLWGDEFTIFVPDLPFHGDTLWNERLLTTEILQELSQKLMALIQVSTFSLLGYSMGGRLALSLSQNFSDKIECLVLVAPEGLKPNLWFDFATGTAIGRPLFKYVMFKPKRILRLLEVCKRLRLVSRSVAVFVEKLMSDSTKRKKVYQTWMCFKELKTSKVHFKEHPFSVYLIFGKQDRLIPLPTKNELQKWQPDRVDIEPAGHLVLRTEQVVQKIYSFLSR